MRTPRVRRPYALFGFLILALIAIPLLASAEGGETAAQVAADAYQRDEEIILLNRNDGRIVIVDWAVGPGLKDLNGKYDAWGGPYYDLAAGDFNGDGTKEIVVIGGASTTAPGPILHTFDPAQATGTSAVPQLAATVASPYAWLLVRCGDIDGDGRAEIVAIHSTSEPGNITQRIKAFDFNTATGQWDTAPLWDYPTGGGFVDLDLADFNGNGKADLLLVRNAVLVGTTYDSVYILDGTNPANQLFYYDFSAAAGIWTRGRAADVNADGVNEVVLMRPEGTISGNFPYAFFPIKITSPTTYQDLVAFGGWGVFPKPEDMETADVNGDGVKEIVGYNADRAGRARVVVYNPRLSTTSAEASTEAVWYAVPEGTLFPGSPNLVMGDANGDRKAEPMFLHRDSHGLRILRYQDNGDPIDYGINGPFSDNFIAANLDAAGVLAGPQMQVLSRVYLYYDLSDTTATAETIQVRNVGSGTFNWVAVPGSCPWLRISRTTGAADETTTLGVIPASLPSTVAGATATCSVGIQATGATVVNDNQTVTVTVTVLNQLFKSLLPVVFRH